MNGDEWYKNHPGYQEFPQPKKTKKQWEQPELPFAHDPKLEDVYRSTKKKSDYLKTIKPPVDPSTVEAELRREEELWNS